MDFELRLKGYGLTTIEIFYYMPDHHSLIQEFIWQTLDIKPEYPRINKFLNYWKNEIKATIKEIILTHDNVIQPSKITNASFFKYMN